MASSGMEFRKVSLSNETAYSERAPVQAEHEPIRVAVVDDHPIMRDGLVHILNSEDGFEVVAQGASAEEAIQIAQVLLPDLILLDISMPGDGMVAARAISHACPAVRIIVLTAHDSEHHVLEALHGGASGYLVKGVSSEELIKTARAVHGGEAYVSPALAAKLLGRRSKEVTPVWDNRGVDLTAREEEILQLVCEGKSNKEIGDHISLTEKTVKHYMTNILQKLHARNRVEAALIAKQRLRK
jgi:two-component system, NarL family, nitrate/nitrite response regulator NarL